MTKIINFLKQKWVIQLLGLLALSALIWFIGPLISIADWAPLESAAVRLIIILVIFMIWISLLFWGYVRSQKKDQELIEEISQTDEIEEEGSAEEEIAQINERFEEAIQIIKKAGGQSSFQKQYLYELPWYIIIGPPGSGKTTALINSELQFPLADHLGRDAIQGVGGTRNCDWWFTDNAVLIDTAGRYTTQDSHASVDASAWQGFLDLLKKTRTRRPINGALIAISLNDLLIQSEEERALHAKAIRSRVQELQQQLGVQFPIYVLFTKCDLVAGFNEFFSTLGAEERRQVWGNTFTYDDAKEAKPAIESFSSAFDSLLERIHERMVTKVHAERDIDKRALIFGFPQQMGNLKTPIKQFLEAAFLPSRFEIKPLVRGFYFTSGTQEGTPIDRLMGNVASTFGLDRSSQPTYSGQGRSYFINKLFREVIFGEANLAGTNLKHEQRRRWFQIGAYAASAFILVTGLVLWTISFTNNQQVLNELNTEVVKYDSGIEKQAYQQTDFSQLEPPLGHLRNAATIYPEDVPLMMGFGLYQGERMEGTTQDAYARVLEGRFLYSVGKRLEELISNNIDNPEVLGLTLRAYLMLGDPNRLVKEDVDLLMSADWSNQYGNSPELIAKLKEHLSSLLEQKFTPLPLDLGLVTQARETLTRTRLSEQIYNRIKANEKAYQNFTLDSVDLLGTKASTVIDSSRGSVNDLQMPGLFTKIGFQKVFLEELDTLSDSAELEFWVRGETTPPATGESQSKVLERELVERYVDDYIQHWRELLNDIQIRQLRSLGGSVEILDAASGSYSPLRKIIQAVQGNTNLLLAQKEAETPVNQATQDKISKAGDLATELSNSTQLGTRQDRLRTLIGSADGFKEQGVEVTLQRVDDTFSAISKLAIKREDNPAPLESLLKELYNLFTYMSDLEDSGSTGVAALEAMKSDRNPGKQLQRKSKDLPEPVKSWFFSFSSVSENAVASRSRSQLSQVWGADVIPFCKRGIEGRYPLSKAKGTDITIEDFSRFFGPNQMLDKYFIENVQPFVDTSFNPWRWKRGKRPSISSKSLAQFEAADEIRNAFFSSGGAEPQVRFRLKPIKLDKNVANFTLGVGNQTLTYSHGPTVSKRFTWPAPNGNGSARILFKTTDGKDLGANYEGTWGWFKLLDKTKVEETQSADKYKLTFKQGSLTAEFELQASSVNNPFDLSALNSFQCRKRL